MCNLQKLAAYTVVKSGRSSKETIICNGISPGHLEEGTLYGLSRPDYVMVVHGKTRVQ
jgi:hypothetical protein